MHCQHLKRRFLLELRSNACLVTSLQPPTTRIEPQFPPRTTNDYHTMGGSSTTDPFDDIDWSQVTIGNTVVTPEPQVGQLSGESEVNDAPLPTMLESLALSP